MFAKIEKVLQLLDLDRTLFTHILSEADYSVSDFSELLAAITPDLPEVQ